MIFITIVDRKIRLYPDTEADADGVIAPRAFEDFEPTLDGAAEFKARIRDLDIKTLMASSTIDFPEDYGLTGEVVGWFVSR
jgi:hypothetical protein